MVTQELEGRPEYVFDVHPLSSQITRSDILSLYHGEKRKLVSQCLRDLNLRLVPSEEFPDNFYLLNFKKGDIHSAVILTLLQKYYPCEKYLLLCPNDQFNELLPLDVHSIRLGPHFESLVWLPLPFADLTFEVCVIDIKSVNVDYDTFVRAITDFEQWIDFIKEIPRVTFVLKWVARQKHFLIASKTIEVYPEIT